jgi:hypothetical protein
MKVIAFCGDESKGGDHFWVVKGKAAIAIVMNRDF